jgi:hypothetical protein
VGRTISRKLDDLGDVARHLADDVADLGRTLRRHGDDLADTARRAGRRLADDLAGVRRALSRHSDELADAARLEERMHTFVNRSDDALRRRLDDGRSHSLTNEPSNPNFKADRAQDQDALNKEIYDKLAETPTGRALLEQIDQIGERPLIRYSSKGMPPRAAASYFPMENEIRIKPELQDLPEEAVLATVAHELAHRTHRPLAGSINSEIFAHFVEAAVWRELDGAKALQNFNQSKLSKFQKELLADQVTIANIQTVQEMDAFVRPRYDGLPDYSVPYSAHIEDYQNEIAEIDRQRELYGTPLMYEHTRQRYKERIEFWGTFKE